MADTRSINTIRITTPNTSALRIITVRIKATGDRTHTSILRIITVRIKATGDRTPILGLGTIIRSMASLNPTLAQLQVQRRASHAENTA
jgi:hypothetical protein